MSQPLPNHVQKAREILNIPTDPDHRVLLSVDGGGAYDMVAVELLKAIERRIAPTGTRLRELFDLVGGVSGGAALTSLIALGYSAHEIETLYADLVRYAFVRRPLGTTLINAPLFTKKRVVDFYEDRVEPSPAFSMGDAVSRYGVDQVYTTKDVWAGQIVALGAYGDERGRLFGPYHDSLLTAALTASLALPNLFSPLERFIDGGASLSQNPALPILYAALKQGPPGKYEVDRITLFSLGSPLIPVMVDMHDILHPPPPRGVTWASWTLATGWGNDISNFNDDLMREPDLFPGLDFRRFDMSYDQSTITLLPNAPLPPLKWPLYCNPVSFFVWLGELFDPPQTLHDLTDPQLYQWAVFDPNGIPLFSLIGEQMAAFIESAQTVPFGGDLVNALGRPLLMTERHDVVVNARHLADLNWFNQQNLST